MAGGRAIEHELVVDAKPLQRGGGDETRHAGADDHDVDDGFAIDGAARHPGFCRQLQPGEILFQARLEDGEAMGRHGGHELARSN